MPEMQGCMRTYEQLHLAAMELRIRLLTEGKEPTESIFIVTHDEYCTILDQPLPIITVNHAERRFYGFKLHVI